MKLPQKNWLEWIVFAVSLLLVASALAYLSYDALTDDDSPPDIEVQLGAPSERRGTFVVPVTVVNHGSQPAEDVVIEVVLTRGEKEESAEFTIAFVPRQSSSAGWVTFTSDPRTADSMQARAVGYEVP